MARARRSPRSKRLTACTFALNRKLRQSRQDVERSVTACPETGAGSRQATRGSTSRRIVQELTDAQYAIEGACMRPATLVSKGGCEAHNRNHRRSRSCLIRACCIHPNATRGERSERLYSPSIHVTSATAFVQHSSVLARRLMLACAVISVFGCGKVEGAAMRGAERGATRAARGAVRGLGRATRADVESAFKREAARDARIVAKPLSKSRTVFRYTTREQSARELERGLAPRTHMTSRGGRGRPRSAASARARYGLPRSPEVRETLRLPAGQRLKLGKAVRGAPGVGEATSSDYVKPNAIRRVVPIK
jgi:hypothetical protein